MPTSKRVTNKSQVNREVGPTARRPDSPGRAYGIPKDKTGLLSWSHVSERMAQAHAYWICTVSPEGRPHATPVDGVWLADRLYFGGSPETPATAIWQQIQQRVSILRAAPTWLCYTAKRARSVRPSRP